MERHYKPTGYVLRRSVVSYVTYVTLPCNLPLHIYWEDALYYGVHPIHTTINTFPNEDYPGYVNNENQTKELRKPRVTM